MEKTLPPVQVMHDIRKLIRALPPSKRAAVLDELSEPTMRALWDDYVADGMGSAIINDLMPAFRKWGF